MVMSIGFGHFLRKSMILYQSLPKLPQPMPLLPKGGGFSGGASHRRPQRLSSFETDFLKIDLHGLFLKNRPAGAERKDNTAKKIMRRKPLASPAYLKER
jgi:hypothetical protein